MTDTGHDNVHVLYEQWTLHELRIVLRDAPDGLTARLLADLDAFGLACAAEVVPPRALAAGLAHRTPEEITTFVDYFDGSDELLAAIALHLPPKALHALTHGMDPQRRDALTCATDEVAAIYHGFGLPAARLATPPAKSTLTAALAALATMTDDEIKMLGLLWEIPAPESCDRHLPDRDEIRAALAAGNVDVAAFPNTVRGLLATLRQP